MVGALLKTHITSFSTFVLYYLDLVHHFAPNTKKLLIFSITKSASSPPHKNGHLSRNQRCGMRLWASYSHRQAVRKTGLANYHFCLKVCLASELNWKLGKKAKAKNKWVFKLRSFLCELQSGCTVLCEETRWGWVWADMSCPSNLSKMYCDFVSSLLTSL